MAVIPPDPGILLRLQNDANILHPATPVQGIPSDLPELRTGQTFTASIQEVLPENTYKALVAGKQITLQLPEGAKPGDTLELVVVDRTPRLVIAQLTEQAATSAASGPYKYTTLSRAGQMIGNLLLPDGETPQAATLNRGEPLLPRAPTSAADLVPLLQKAVTQSGLFYESHQSQWVAGKLPIEQLLQEPQGQRSAPATLIQHDVPHAAVDAGRFPALSAATASLPDSSVRNDNQAQATSSQQQAAALAQTVPDELRPIVQQQLDAVATQRLLWHGEAWPNQPMDWEIVREDENGGPSIRDEEASWRSTLRLDTPRLGHVDATLRLTASGLQMTLSTPVGTSAGDLQNGAPALAASLEAAGISLLSLQVRHEPE